MGKIVALLIIAIVLLLLYFANRSIRSNKLLDLLNKRDPSKYQEAIDEYNTLNPGNEVSVELFSRNPKDLINNFVYLKIVRLKDGEVLFELIKKPGENKWKEG
jgi:hypothetical protein